MEAERRRRVTHSVVTSMAVVAVVVVAAWFVMSLLGIHFDLATSLVISVVLTALLGLAANAFRTHRRA